MPNRSCSHKRMRGEGETSAGIAGKEVFQCLASGERGAACAREENVAFAVSEGPTAEAVAVELTAEFERVFSEGIRNMVDHLVSLVRSLNFGPFESTQCLKEAAEGMNFDSRQTAVEGISYTVVDTQAGGGLAVVGRKSR